VLPTDDYRLLFRELLAHRTLSRRSGSPRLALPPDVRPWARRLSESWVAELAERRYDVTGSLDELLADDGDEPFEDPDRPDEPSVSDAAMQSIETLLAEAARLHEEACRARRERDEAWEELERSRTLVFRVKRRLVREADRNRAAAFGLAVYRRLRGRSSRSA
jgi:hypothetical protein